MIINDMGEKMRVKDRRVRGREREKMCKREKEVQKEGRKRERE